MLPHSAQLLLYRIAVRLYGWLIGLAGFFHPKARLWTQGRQDLFGRLKEGRKSLRPDCPTVWVHCASVGEFEQGRPLIEALRDRQPDLNIVLSFFSPSGYQLRKNYPVADLVCYLPLDTPGNARRFLDLLDPALAIFVKYEFWFEHLAELNRRKVPTFLISAVFRPKQVFFRWYGSLFRQMLRTFDAIFVQERSSAELLEELRHPRVLVAGDTRVDRVCQVAGQVFDTPLLDVFTGSSPLLIAGSTWPEDEQLLIEHLKNGALPNWKYLIVPHELTSARLEELQAALPMPSIRFTRSGREEAESARIMILDTMGMLSGAYRYGRIAWIGGGFGAGIHNVLEAAVYGLPTLFGTRYRKFPEATALVSAGGAFPVDTYKTLQQTLRSLQDATSYERASAQARRYIAENQGATGRILAELLPLLSDGEGGRTSSR